MKIIKNAKKNLPLVLIIILYAALFIIRPALGQSAAKTSLYYLKEMLMIMPVVFVLTALLDTWVPKKTIVNYLGSDAHIKGILLSFALGAVSAGPIYAAFPVCIMLHKKGASIRNIVIILSSWAVIKVPMLLNEVKFLGPKFMIIRWILTVIAILVMSYIMSKLVHDEDIPVETALSSEEVQVNQDACIGCSMCTKVYPELFVMENNKAHTISHQFEPDSKLLDKVKDSCPVSAISGNH